MSGAAFFGLSLISGSKLVFTLAVIRYLSQLWFLSKVEQYVAVGPKSPVFVRADALMSHA